VFKRNPDLRGRCVAAAMPIGNSEDDYQAVANGSPKTVLFSDRDGLFHLVYAGTMWPPAHPVVKRFFEALTVLRDKNPEVIQRLRVHFIGTGKTPACPEGQLGLTLRASGSGLGLMNSLYASAILMCFII